MIPKEFIDNSDGNKLKDFLNEILKAYPKTPLDIATAFFNIEAYTMIRKNLDEVSRFRLLLGKSPIINIKTTLGDFLLKQVREEIESFDLTKEIDEIMRHFRDFMEKDIVEVKLFKKFLSFFLVSFYVVSHHILSVNQLFNFVKICQNFNI